MNEEQWDKYQPSNFPEFWDIQRQMLSPSARPRCLKFGIFFQLHAPEYQSLLAFGDSEFSMSFDSLRTLILKATEH